jgi:hypothetical protein
MRVHSVYYSNLAVVGRTQGSCGNVTNDFPCYLRAEEIGIGARRAWFLTSSP